MNKLWRYICLGIIASFPILPVAALDVPAYVSDPQDITKTTEEILAAMQIDSRGLASSAASAEKYNEMYAEYALHLYADALSARAQIVGSEAGGSGMEKMAGQVLGMLGGMDNKPQILQDEIKKYLSDIAHRVEKIVELEAEISNLQGLTVLNSLRGELVDDEGEK